MAKKNPIAAAAKKMAAAPVSNSVVTEVKAAEVKAETKTEAAKDSALEGPITVISREDGSGTRGAFIELFGIEVKNDAGEKVDMTTDDAEITDSTSVMMTSVAGNTEAIGYI